MEGKVEGLDLNDEDDLDDIRQNIFNDVDANFIKIDLRKYIWKFEIRMGKPWTQK